MHPAPNQYSFPLNKAYAAVQVRRKGKTFEILPGVSLVKADALFTELPPDYQIVGADNQVVRPAGRFLISAETIDPFHMIVDWNV